MDESHPIDGLRTGADGVTRCVWCGDDELYVRYHDTEWGRPVVDSVRLYEKLCLEGFQSGLSWLTILRKRDHFRVAFAGFDIETVARFGEADVERLLGDAGIVRHRGKIVSTINNAARAAELIAEFGSIIGFLDQYRPERMPAPTGLGVIPASTPESTAISKDLKRRGWTFVGPTTVYAFMQSMGLVNDHMAGCQFRTP